MKKKVVTKVISKKQGTVATVETPVKTETPSKKSLAAKARWAAIRERNAEKEKTVEAFRSIPFVPPTITFPKDENPVISVTKSSSHVGVLSPADINGIISTCHTNNVLSFQYAGLRLLFKKSINEPTSAYPIFPNKGSPERPGSLLDEIKGASPIERQSMLQNMSDEATEELEFMKINDPVSYEEFMQSGDAEDVRD